MKLFSFFVWLYYQSLIIGNIEYYTTDTSACEKLDLISEWSIKSAGVIISSDYPEHSPVHAFFPYIDNGNTSTNSLLSCRKKSLRNHYLTEIFAFNTSKENTEADWGASMRFLLIS